MKSIFLCHSHSDKKFVKKLESDLKIYGIKVWVDDAEIHVGDSLITKIGNGIKEMDYLGVVLSKESIQSEWVKKEVEIAMNQEIEGKKVKVLPFLLKNCELPPFIQGKYYLDFKEDEKYWENVYKLLGRLEVKDNTKIELEKLKFGFMVSGKLGVIKAWEFFLYLGNIFNFDPWNRNNKPIILPERYINDIRELKNTYLHTVLEHRKSENFWSDILFNLDLGHGFIGENEVLLMIYSFKDLKTELFSSPSSIIDSMSGSNKLFSSPSGIIESMSDSFNRRDFLILITEILLLKQGYFFGFPMHEPKSYSKNAFWLLQNEKEMLICPLFTITDPGEEATAKLLYFMNNDGIAIICFGDETVPLGTTSLEAIKTVKKHTSLNVNSLYVIPGIDFMGLNPNSKRKEARKFKNVLKKHLGKNININIVIVYDENKEILKEMEEIDTINFSSLKELYKIH